MYAVCVCESDKTESRQLERKRSNPFDRLITSVSKGKWDTDTLTSLAGRLARLDQKLDEKNREEIETRAQGLTLKQLVNNLLDAVDPDKHIEKAKELYNTEKPTTKQVKEAAKELATIACTPFDNPMLRRTLIDIRQRSEQTIDIVSKDEIIFAGFDPTAARDMIRSFKEFIEENKDELTALQIIYSKPYAQRHLTYEAIKQLSEVMLKPPHKLSPELLWMAYQQLEKSKVKGAGPQKLLTNIISLVKYAIGESDILEPFPDIVDRKFAEWLAQQEASGREFTSEQKEWLHMIKDHIATSLRIEMEDFELSPFNQEGGASKVYQIFGTQLTSILQEMNMVLAT